MIRARINDRNITEFYDDVTDQVVDLAISSDVTVVASRNTETIKQRLTTALGSNLTYINRAAPTTAQNTAQIKALTRQMNALIRLNLKALDTIADA